MIIVDAGTIVLHLLALIVLVRLIVITGSSLPWICLATSIGLMLALRVFIWLWTLGNLDFEELWVIASWLRLATSGFLLASPRMRRLRERQKFGDNRSEVSGSPAI